MVPLPLGRASSVTMNIHNYGGQSNKREGVLFLCEKGLLKPMNFPLWFSKENCVLGNTVAANRAVKKYREMG